MILLAEVADSDTKKSEACAAANAVFQELEKSLNKRSDITEDEIDRLIKSLSSTSHIFVRRSRAAMFFRLLESDGIVDKDSANAIARGLAQWLAIEADLPDGEKSGNVVRACCKTVKQFPDLEYDDIGSALQRLSEASRLDIAIEAESALTAVKAPSSLSSLDDRDHVHCEQSGATPDMTDLTLQLPKSGDGSQLLDEEVSALRNGLVRAMKILHGLEELPNRVAYLEKQILRVVTALRRAEILFKDDPSNTGDSIPERILRIRMEADMTLREIAERIGISESQMSRISRGLSKPNPGTERRLEKLLKSTVEEEVHK